MWMPETQALVLVLVWQELTGPFSTMAAVTVTTYMTRLHALDSIQGERSQATAQK